ncbi:MAG: hypothetical protein ACOX42_11465 [Clostridia bacterium]|jgi:hypothetical protein|nr:hypothetical protein [Clostridiales bacterium]
MAKRKRTLVERAYRANVLSDGVLTRIESLEGTNLTPQNTDFEQLKSLAGPEKKEDNSDPYDREQSPKS